MIDWSARVWRAYETLPPLLKDQVATALGAWDRHRRYGAYFRAQQLQLEESQWWSPEEHAFAAGERLRRFAHRAATTVPYYRDLFLRSNVGPRLIRAVEDLERLPLLDRATVSQQSERFHPEADDAMAAFLLWSAGPREGALTVPISQECLEREWAFRWQQLSWFGVKQGQRIATFADHPLVIGFGPEPPFWVTNRAKSEMLFSYRRLNDVTLPSYVEQLTNWQPSVIHGPPTALHGLALGLRDLGDTTVRPQVVIAEGETLDWEQRAAIELQFQCKLGLYYSSAKMVAHVAECEHGGLHVRPEHSIVELIGRTGITAAPGESAEIVGTGIANISFPLIRYRTGDGAMLAERPCVCNRGGTTLRSLTLGEFRGEETAATGSHQAGEEVAQAA